MDFPPYIPSSPIYYEETLIVNPELIDLSNLSEEIILETNPIFFSGKNKPKEQTIEELLSLFASEKNPYEKIEILNKLPEPKFLSPVELSFVNDVLDETILKSQEDESLIKVIKRFVLKFAIGMSSLENIIDPSLLEYVMYFGKIKFSRSFRDEIQKTSNNKLLKNLITKRFPNKQKLVFI